MARFIEYLKALQPRRLLWYAAFSLGGVGSLRLAYWAGANMISATPQHLGMAVAAVVFLLVLCVALLWSGFNAWQLATGAWRAFLVGEPEVERDEHGWGERLSDNRCVVCFTVNLTSRTAQSVVDRWQLEIAGRSFKQEKGAVFIPDIMNEPLSPGRRARGKVSFLLEGIWPADALGLLSGDDWTLTFWDVDGSHLVAHEKSR